MFKNGSLWRPPPLNPYLHGPYDDGEEEDVESSYDQKRLLQHQDLIEGIMDLVHGAQRQLLLKV